jgi:hypothetical protein
VLTSRAPGERLYGQMIPEARRSRVCGAERVRATARFARPTPDREDDDDGWRDRVYVRAGAADGDGLRRAEARSLKLQLAGRCVVVRLARGDSDEVFLRRKMRCEREGGEGRRIRGRQRRVGRPPAG